MAPLIVQSDDVEDWIKPVAGKPLTFQTAGESEAVTLVPYHKLFDQRYVVYWRVLREGSEAHRDYLAKERQRKELEARTVDRVEIGNETSEKKHSLDGSNTESGSHQGRTWRHARDGGWFSYRLAVLPDQPMTLRCTYWGSDVGRTFDVLVDGQRISTETLDNNVPGGFFDQQRKIPRELTAGKRQITVKFQAHPGSMAGGVFGCFMLK